MTEVAARQLPGLQADNRAFWTGGERGQLLIARCGTCATYVHPPLPRCGQCGGSHVAPEPVSGRGRVATFTINRQPWVPGLAVPYVIAAIELVEQAQLYVFSNLVDCQPDAVKIGMAVEVSFERHEDVYLPLFRPLLGPAVPA